MGGANLRILVLFYLLVSAAGLGVVAYFDLWEGIAPPSLEPDSLYVLSVGLGLGLAMVVVCRLLSRWVPAVRKLEEGFRGLLGPMTPGEVLLAAVASGVAEELFFRAALQPLLGLWVTSAIFALLHIGPTRDFRSWPVMAFVAGVLLGVLFEWSGSVWPSVLAHGTVNGLNLLYLLRREPSAQEPSLIDPE